MTILRKPVTRRTKHPINYQGRQLVITLHPGVNGDAGTIELREAGRHKSVSVSLGAVYDYAWVSWGNTQRAKLNNLVRKIQKAEGVGKRLAIKMAKEQLKVSHLTSPVKTARIEA